MAEPTQAQILAEAYRRGLLPPDRAAAYQEAARRGLVNDPYAASRASADPVTGYLTTAARAIPGLTELGAGYSAALRSADDLVNGRKVDFGGRWNQARAEQQGEVDQLARDHPIAANNATALGIVAPAGVAAGSALARGAARLAAAEAPKVVARGVVPAAGRLAAAGARNAMTGAAVGSAYGFAQPGTLEQRTQNAFAAMGPGAAAGVVAPVVLSGAGKLAGGATSATRKAINAMRPEVEAPAAPASVTSTPQAAAPAPAASTAAAPAQAPAAPASVATVAAPGPATASAGGLTPVETSALGKFVRVAKPEINAMTGKAAAYSGVGIDPTLVDTTGRRGQAVVRALASRPTPAQDDVEAFADQRRVGLASRMSNQARDIISSDPRTPEDIAQSVIDARNQQANQDFGPVRSQMVSVTPAMADALTSPFGIRAIRTAWQRAVDPDAREALRLLYDHVNPGQGGQQAGSLDGAQISVGQAQDISKALFDDADSAKDPGDSGPMKYFGQAIREGASRQAPDYEVALGRFANASGLAEAPAIGKRLLSSPTDTFAADVDRIRAIPSEPDAQGNAMDPQGIALARPGARRAIELASGGGRPGTAMGVAQTLADAPEQQAKNAALLGDDDAQRLQDAMRLERQSVLNAANASPGAGSNTFLNALAGGAVNGEVNPGEVAKTVGSVAAAAHGNVIPGAMQVLGRYLSSTRAFSDDEAQALAQMAIDPTKHDDALAFIASRAGPQAAASAAPMMQNVAASAGAAAAAAPAATPPNAFQPQGQPPAQ